MVEQEILSQAATSNSPSVKKKGHKQLLECDIYVIASFNNTKITIVDTHGNLVVWSSAGERKFKGSRKSTPHAAESAARWAIERAITRHGIKIIRALKVKGPGPGRDAAVRAISQSGLLIHILQDITPLPHNGCRPKGRRRV